MASGEYMIIHPEKAELWELLVFVFYSNLPTFDFVETNVDQTHDEASFKERLFIIGTIVYMKLAMMISSFSDKSMAQLEYALNFLYFNGGLLGLIWNFLTGSVKSPQQDDALYRSMRSFISGPVGIDKKVTKLIKYVPHDDLEEGVQDESMLELAIKASSLAYENGSHIQSIVDNQWQMNFVEFFECWNFSLGANGTEAFVFCDKTTDPNWIVVAFRGTEQFNDWVTDSNFSWIDTKLMGAVHIGFMKALGLQDDNNFSAGFPQDYTGSENLAYYSIRALLLELMAKYSNAKIMVTGHSLGGALTVLFVSLLSYHGHQEILDRIQYVKTFGQPRVGDATFGDYMNSLLGDRYRRMVYRYDIVPRIPFDHILWMKFKHFGTCIQYDGWFSATTGTEESDKNYFNIVFLPLIYWGYFVDFWRTIWWAITRRQWEGFMGTLYRIVCIILPGVVFHSCGNYMNAATNAKVTYKIKA